MKRFSFLIVFCLIFLVGCSQDNNKYTLLEENDNYELYAYENDDILSDYVYFVFNHDGEKIDSGYYEVGEPRFKRFENDVLKVSTGSGTNVAFITYYDLNQSLISDEYQNVYYEDGNLIAYITYQEGDTYLCVKHIFDDQLLLKEKLQIKDIMTTDYQITIKDNVVTVEHAKDSSYETIVETFSFKELE